jgi:hypothetical protein
LPVGALQGNHNFHAAIFAHIELQANTFHYIWLHIFGAHSGSPRYSRQKSEQERMMQISDTLESKSKKVPPLSPSPLPVEVLVKEVYEASPPKVKKGMLNLLVGAAYEASPLTVRKSLLELLIRSVGVLGLITVAGGVFANIRLRGGWPNVLVNLDDLQMIKKADVVALVDYVQQVSAGALVDLVQLLVNHPSLTGSGAVAVLATIMLRRGPDRRQIPRDFI